MKAETIGELLEVQATQFRDREAVVYPERSIRWTYGEFNEKCTEAAKGLLALGITKGDHIAIWAPNVPEWLILQFASARIGAVLVTVNTNYQQQELTYLLEQSDAKMLILTPTYRDQSYLSIVRSICPAGSECKRLPSLESIVLIDDVADAASITWQEMIDKGNQSIPSLPEQILSPDEVINMQYTSGTTGFPKGVMLSHRNIMENARAIGESMKLTEEDRLCIPVPFFHCFGCVLGTLTAVTAGAAMIPVIEFQSGRVLSIVEKEKATALHGVPTMFIGELNDPDFDTYDLSSLRTGIMAGSTCPIEVMKGVTEKMGVRELTIAYGQTESSPVITQTRTDDPIELRVETVGQALPGVEVKIIDPITGESKEAGEQGELCTRGYHVMTGYYKNPEETARVIDPEGWLHTGDLAVMDEEGYVRITGRLKDMVIRGGENIYPREIEEFLYTHPAVSDVQVVGVPDAKYGEELMAWVILKQGASVTADDLRTYCQGKISRHKIPRYIELTDSYPMTASGKIQKFKLREQALDIVLR